MSCPFYFTGKCTHSNSHKSPEMVPREESNMTDIKTSFLCVSAWVCTLCVYLWVCNEIPKIKLISHEICGKNGKGKLLCPEGLLLPFPLYHTHHRSIELKFNKISAVSQNVLHQWAVISPIFSNQTVATILSLQFQPIKTAEN